MPYSSSTDQIDTNVDNYTVSELLTILDLTDAYDQEQIVKKSEYYINKFNSENNQQMSNFFHDIQINLLQYSSQLTDENNDQSAELPSAATQTNDWWSNEALIQKNNPTQSDKNTQRKQKIDVYDNSHFSMKRVQLGVANEKSIPVAQDVLNPTLSNTTTRIIILDSQFRQNTASVNESNTNYTLDLSEPLLNVLSLRLYSYSIPYTWYSFDVMYGNTCFWITITDTIASESLSICISIAPGSYNTTTIVSEITNSIITANINISTIPATADGKIAHGVPVYIDPNNGKITLHLWNATYTYNEKVYVITETSIITFFDPSAKLSCVSNSCTNTNIAINQTMGWSIGYRVPFVNVLENGNISTAIPELYGSKYFIIVLDDLNQNHINNGLIGITEISKIVKMPSYYSPDLPYICSPPDPVSNIDPTYNSRVQVLPSAPRILTQSQIYTINEIMKNNERTTFDYKLKAPCVSDTFAIIPLKIGSSSLGDIITEYGGTLQDNKRIYFGPVNISRLRIQLLDDKGNTVNLNGSDWCITIIAELLYQY